MTDLNSILAPGMFVQHPDYPDWGTGQVLVLDGSRVSLLPVFDP